MVVRQDVESRQCVVDGGNLGRGKRAARACSHDPEQSVEPPRAESTEDGASGQLADLTLHVRHSTCRICGVASLAPVLDLGGQPLANAFVRPEDAHAPEDRYPLVFCRCESCGHAQLSVTVAPEILFREYPYVSGTSDTIPAHFAAYAADVAQRILPEEDPFVVEIGSNDGTLLRAFDRTRVRTVGVEPATNIAAIARQAGIETLNEFFQESLAREIARTYGLADAIIANNVVAHVDDLAGLARGVGALLGSRGVFVAEFPYLVDMLEGVEYDTIYHEHLSYFSVRAASEVFARAGLVLYDVRRVAVHGGSLRIFVGRDRQPTAAVAELTAYEREAGYDSIAPFLRFAERVRRQRDGLRALLDERQRSGDRIAGYGAAAKGNTLLNYCEIDSGLLAYIADRSPLKQGLLTPGGHIPVLPVETLHERRPDTVLLLAWNFADEILRQQSLFRASGGQFILPIPMPRTV